jgi:hypothetical protein
VSTVSEHDGEEQPEALDQMPSGDLNVLKVDAPTAGG